MDLNVLKQYMDFFKQNHIGGHSPQAVSSPWGAIPNSYNEDGAAATWAMNALGGGQSGGSANRMPDYFGSGQGQQGYQPSQYVQPQRFNGAMPPSTFQPSPMTGPANNFLAHLMGRH